jgi:glycosyltransferase involved in cell wall biosynthesis
VSLRTAVVLHIFYEDVSLDLLRSLAEVRGTFDLFVTTPLTLNDAVTAALQAFPRKVTVVECENKGQDIAPFLSVIPRLIDCGYDLVCKLHTKRGVGELGELWRRVACGAALGSRFAQVESLFGQEESLALVGAKDLYMSARAHMYGNLARVEEVVQSAFPDKTLPPDWGFFAGSVFWIRPKLLESLARAAVNGSFDSPEVQRDGQLAHAFERVIGLVPVLSGMSVGLVGRDEGSPIHIVPAPGKPSREPTSQTLRRILVASEPRPDLARVFKTENPLVHYIRTGERLGLQPNPVFDPTWYAEKNPEVLASGTSPLRHFVEVGAGEMRNPGPGFDSAFYMAAYDDVRRAGMLPVTHFLRYGRAEGRQPAPDPEMDAAMGRAVKFGRPHPEEARQVRGGAKLVGPAGEGRGRPVLVVGHWSKPGPLFGAERSLLDVIRGLYRRGYEVHAALPHDNPAYADEILEYAQTLSIFEYDWWKDGRPLDEGAVIRFMRLIRQHEIALVHVNTIMLREPLEAARRLNVTRIVHAREIIQQDRHLTDYIGLQPDRIIEQIRERTDYLICNSATTAENFRLPGWEPLRVYNGVDVSDLNIENVILPPEIRVGLISSNTPKKGIADFVNLAYLAQQKNLPLRFVLIGPENEYTRNLAKVAGLPQLPGNLEVAGYASSPRAALQDLNIVMNLSHFAESFGRSVAEAMAAGRPVIVYDHGALPEIIRDGVDGFVIPFQRYEEALAPLEELSANQARMREMGENARQRALQEFSLEAMEEALASAYRQIPFRNTWVSKPAEALRIAYFMWHFPVPSETFVLNELRALKEQGVDVRVFCRFSPHPDFVPDFPIDWTNVTSPDELAEALLDSGRTVVHAHFTYPTVTEFVWPACERTGIDFTFTAHAQDIFRYENDKRNRIGEIGRSPFCRKIFVLGRFHHDYLVERGVPPAKLMINSQMSDALLIAKRPEAASVGRRFDHRRICAVQRFVEKKGLGLLIEAAEGLKGLGVSVDLYGYGPLEEALAKEIEQRGVDNVRLCGTVSDRADLLKVFSEHDMLITPSVRAADGDMDGIPTILMEAMGTGLPVASSSIASVPDLIRDGVNGLLFEAGDADAIVAAVERFYRMPAGRIRAMAENARETVQAAYDPDHVLANLLRHWRGETVDLIIVSWNNLPELRHVVERLFKYTTLPFRLIVCDNDSAPEVVDYLDELALRYRNVTVIHKGYNSYVGPGTNTAVDAGKSKYAIYVCGKEGFAINYGWEAAMIKYMERNPAVGLAGMLGYSPSYLTGRQYVENHPVFAKFRNPGFAAANPDRTFRHVQGGLFVVRRAMYEAIGGFSEAVPHDHTDTEYSYYAESCGWELGAVPGIVSLYTKTRPGLLSRLDENVLAAHPPTLAMSDLLDRIATRSTALCDLCGWAGPAFEVEAEACPKCGSEPGERTVFRYLAQSVLTFRRLAGLYVDPHPALEPIWRQQFVGPVLSLADFDLCRAESEAPPGGFDVIFLAHALCEGPVRAKRLARILKPDGVLLLREAVDENGAPLQAQADLLAEAGIAIAERVRYASAVVRFDWRALLVCRRMAA